ncbi:hypothetical protein Pmani_020922 [Petrolisthes manimaculis]|uniref:Peptidase A2 domain-containing protein n=1 Tax=Petrolisthes manimaculis TaxID=1843537 RepID=A0AAE1PF96_9EUCA|nr:hypothetical protein Pmani_020922 [Petrolisthes manimaculis]
MKQPAATVGIRVTGPKRRSAREAQCRSCRKIGHYDKCCRSRSSEDTTPDSYEPQPCKIQACISADNTTSSDTPTPVCVHVKYGKTTSRLHMLPDTGVDVTIIGEKHMSTLQLSRSSLQPLPSNIVLTADGSEISPALGYFQATLQLGRKWCTTRIQVHKVVTTPLLSYSHCKELNIIPQEFPKPILQVQHINRCTETPLCNIASPSDARKYFLHTLQSKLQDNDRTLQDIRESAREDSEYAHLLQLSVGDHVHIQNPTTHRWDKVEIVMGRGRTPRDYDDGVTGDSYVPFQTPVLTPSLMSMWSLALMQIPQ